ncbi:hypothetical protein MHYP_G00225090 [Metynnis hypsauchen]
MPLPDAVTSQALISLSKPQGPTQKTMYSKHGQISQCCMRYEDVPGWHRDGGSVRWRYRLMKGVGEGPDVGERIRGERRVRMLLRGEGMRKRNEIAAEQTRKHCSKQNSVAELACCMSPERAPTAKTILRNPASREMEAGQESRQQQPSLGQLHLGSVTSGEAEIESHGSCMHDALISIDRTVDSRESRGLLRKVL